MDFLETSDLTSIASYVFINKHKEATGEFPRGVIYNKFMTLFYRDNEQGKLMNLPHCWYRGGDEVVRYHLKGLQWDHEEAGLTTVKWCGNPPRYSSLEPFVISAEKYADEFISKYSVDRGHELAIDDVYSEAPFDFLNDYRKLREALKTISYVSENPHKNVFLPLFETAIKSFPTEFSRIGSTVDTLSKIFHLAIDSAAPLNVLKDIVEDFWFWFCYHLRIECNENVPRSTIEVWKEKIPWEDEMYDRNLQDTAFELTEGDSDDPFLTKILEERLTRMEKLDEVLNFFSDELMEGFEDFIKGCR